MAYLLSKVFPFIWPYLKELIAGWIKHPYFTHNGYKMAMKKFGLLLIFIAFLVIGNEYVATLRELELIKQEIKTKPSAYVSFEEVKNYHQLFNSPETLRALEESRATVLDLNSQVVELTHKLELEKTLHAQTKSELESYKAKPKAEQIQPTTKSNKDKLNDRLNPKKDN